MKLHASALRGETAMPAAIEIETAANAALTHARAIGSTLARRWTSASRTDTRAAAVGVGRHGIRVPACVFSAVRAGRELVELGLARERTGALIVPVLPLIARRGRDACVEIVELLQAGGHNEVDAKAASGRRTLTALIAVGVFVAMGGLVSMLTWRPLHLAHAR
jgi:hypothetical protein